jgi:hypothetical protein
MLSVFERIRNQWGLVLARGAYRPYRIDELCCTKLTSDEANLDSDQGSELDPTVLNYFTEIIVVGLMRILRK